MEQKKIQSFTDLIAWQEGHKLVLNIYKVTKSFPKEEMFSLTNQLRRAVVSVTSNIAGGYNHKTLSDKPHFYTILHGSVAKVQNQLLIARDLQYLDQKQFSQIAEQTVLTHKLLTALIKSISKN